MRAIDPNSSSPARNGSSPSRASSSMSRTNSARGGGGGPPGGLVGKWLEASWSHPISTSVATSGAMCGLGCGIGQAIAIARGKQRSFEARKLGFFILFGTLISGPLCHFWFKYLHSSKTSLSVKQLILYKMCMDIPHKMSVFGLLFNLLYTLQKLDSKRFKDNFTLNVNLWPFAIWFNYNFVPAQMQEAFASLLPLLWSAALCSKGAVASS
eukprot:CAMPEP_0114137490 /NCGR_PEP_ID=MMETSP0043_2-20121206/15802_1 /TAXON_ID=464988 /ORGANISM="Hemiselmis andersenii, Strain CCMP644" /LENGTH=210 /DNA_ID=CAMNT_0001231367 /DNA_START=33 /DNA_END=665 /DNA_ORIENTATION=-